MTTLPDAYAWLAGEPGPKMLREALKLYGTLEASGDEDNPTILAWAAELGLSAIYSHDVVPWCGLYLAVVAHRAGKPIPDLPLRALSWADFGVHSPAPALGDVLVFRRQAGGHVALYVGQDSEAYHCLGGNQSDSVCIRRIDRDRIYAVRRPDYKMTPPNVRPICLDVAGELSRNES